jgi:hypothetical protein
MAARSLILFLMNKENRPFLFPVPEVRWVTLSLFCSKNPECFSQRVRVKRFWNGLFSNGSPK